MNIEIFYRENDRTQGIMSSLLHLVKDKHNNHSVKNFEIEKLKRFTYCDILLTPDAKLAYSKTKFIIEYSYKHKAKSKNKCRITKSFLPDLLDKVFNTPHEALCSILNHPYYLEKVYVYQLNWSGSVFEYKSHNLPKHSFRKHSNITKEFGFIRDTDYNSIIDTLNLKIKEKRDELNLLVSTLDKVYLDVDKKLEDFV